MSADDDISAEKAKRKFRLIWRTVLFLIINGPTTVLALGTWVRLGAGASKHAAASNGTSSLKLFFIVWLVGIIVSALAIFKK